MLTTGSGTIQEYPLSGSSLPEGRQEVRRYYFEPDTYDTAIPEADYGWAAGQLALCLATHDSMPRTTFAPQIADYLRLTDGHRDYLPPRAARIRADRYGYASALGTGAIEHLIDWQSVDPDDPAGSITLLPFDGEPPRPVSAADSDYDLFDQHVKRETTRTWQAVNRWHARNPQYLDEMATHHDELLEQDDSRTLTNQVVEAELAFMGDGAVEIAQVLLMMKSLREHFGDQSGVGCLDRESYIQAAHDAGVDLLLYRARFAITRLRKSRTVSTALPNLESRWPDLSRLRFQQTTGQNGSTRYTLDHDGQHTHVPQPGDAEMIGKRQMCPTLYLNPDNPRIRFRPQKRRPRTGFGSHLEAYLHAGINTAVADGALMPDDLR